MLFIISSKVLRSRDCFQITGIISLQTFDKLTTNPSGEKGIFPISFRSSAPTRVTGHIYCRRPEREQITGTSNLFLSIVQFFPASSCFIRNSSGYPKNKIRIPGSSQAYSLRKHSKLTRTNYSVQGFIAMIIFVYVKTGNFSCVIHQQRDLFFHRQSIKQI